MTARRNGKDTHSNGKKSASELMEQLAASLNERISTIEKSILAHSGQDDYYAAKGAKTVSATEAKPKRARRHNSPEMPTGKKWFHIVGRGVRRVREQKGLSVPEAAEKLQIHTNSWYKVESGQYKATTGTHLQEMLEMFYPKTDSVAALQQLLKIGEPLP